MSSRQVSAVSAALKRLGSTWKGLAALAPLALLAALAGSMALVVQTVPVLASDPIPTDVRRLIPPFAKPVPPEPPRTVQLDAGPRLFVVEDRTWPWIEVLVATPFGAANEGPGEAGLAQWTAAAMRRAGVGAWSGDEFDFRLDILGLELNLFAGETRSVARLRALPSTLDPGLEALVAALRNPRFEGRRVLGLRRSIASALRVREDDPLEKLEAEWATVLGLDEKEADSSTSTSASSMEMARTTALAGLGPRDLEEFHRRTWPLDEWVIAVAGAVDGDAIVARFEALLASPLGSPEEESGPTPSPLDEAGIQDSQDSPETLRPPVSSGSAENRPVDPEPKRRVVAFDTDQAKVLAGSPIPAAETWDGEQAALDALLERVLAGRVFGRLRTLEGLVYRTTAEIWREPGARGQLRIFFEARGAVVAEALEVIEEIVEGLRRRVIPEAELEGARRGLLDERRRGWDEAEEVAGLFAEDHLLGRPAGYRTAFVESVLSTGAVDLRQHARLLFPESGLWWVVVANPQELSSELVSASTDP